MNKYEILYILKADLSDEAREAQIEKYKNLVSASGAQVSVDKWGVKKFATPMDYKTEGFYVLMNFEGSPALPAEIERQMRISDEVVRYMTVRKSGKEPVKKYGERAKYDYKKADKTDGDGKTADAPDGDGDEKAGAVGGEQNEPTGDGNADGGGEQNETATVEEKNE